MRRGRVRPAACAAVVLVALVAGACSSDEDGAAATTTTRSSGADPSTTTAGGGGRDGVRLVDLGLDLDQPIDLTSRPGSTSLLVAERAGRIREAVADGSGFRLRAEPVLDITDRVSEPTGERGLLGLTASPTGDRLFVSYTERSHGDSRVDEYPLTGTDGSLRADPAGREQLLAIRQPYPNHNGGSLAFGPDGMLYAGFGDGGGGGDPEGHAQDPTSLLGKVLRLDPDGVDDADHDGVPDDNPFVRPRTGSPAPLPYAGAEEVWLTGVRNPWRLSFDASGDLWIGDVGQDHFEEVDVLRPQGTTSAGYGADLGWDLYEGTARFDQPDPAPGAASAGPFVAPVHTYSHDDGCSITGGYVAETDDVPSLRGAYLFGDYCATGVRALRLDGDRAQVTDLGLDVGAVVSFGRGPRGELYVISLDEGVQRLAAA